MHKGKTTKPRNSMTEMRKIIHIIVTLIFPLIAYSQNKMSKNEIYGYLIKTEKNSDNAISYETQFDSLVIKFIDNLKVTGLDTFGVYAEEYDGSYSSDTCACGIFPWFAYVQWILNGKTYHQKFTGCCLFKAVLIENSALINYYMTNCDKIERDRIMPVITGAKRNQKGEIILEEEIADHTVYYTIYCSINRFSKLVSFEEYELVNQDNIFFADNINSSINNWRKTIKKQVNNIRN